jgi:hypothetical protein
MSQRLRTEHIDGKLLKLPFRQNRPCGCIVRDVTEKKLYCGPHYEPVAEMTLVDGDVKLFPYDKILNCPCYLAINGKLTPPKAALFREPVALDQHNCRSCTWCRNTRYLSAKLDNQSSKTVRQSCSSLGVEQSTSKTDGRKSLAMEELSDRVVREEIHSPDAHRLLGELLQPEPVPVGSRGELEPSNARVVSSTVLEEGPSTVPSVHSQPRPPELPREDFKYVSTSVQTLPVGNRRRQGYRGRQDTRFHRRSGVVLSGEGISLT